MSSYLTVSPLPEPPLGNPGGLLSVALSPPHDGPSLTATLPYGVPTFLSRPNGTSDCPVDSDSHGLSQGKGSGARCVEDPLAIGANVDSPGLHDLDDYLGWDVHMAAAARAAANLDYGHSAAALEHHFVLARQPTT